MACAYPLDEIVKSSAYPLDDLDEIVKSSAYPLDAIIKKFYMQ